MEHPGEEQTVQTGDTIFNWQWIVIISEFSKSWFNEEYLIWQEYFFYKI